MRKTLNKKFENLFSYWPKDGVVKDEDFLEIEVEAYCPNEGYDEYCDLYLDVVIPGMSYVYLRISPATRPLDVVSSKTIFSSNLQDGTTEISEMT